MPSLLSNPTVFTNQGDGTDAWQNTQNILVQDGTTSTCATTLKNDTAQSLACSSVTFPFIKGGGSIVVLGFQVQIWRRATAANAVNDSTVRLFVNGALAGQNKASPAAWPTTITRIDYGSDTDLWGLTQEQANSIFTNGSAATNFGLLFKANPQNPATLHLDYIGITATLQVRDMKVRVGGQFVPVDPSVRVNNSFTNVNEAYVYDNGQWNLIYLR